MAREGQARVEVRPGVWLWLNEADRKAHEERVASPGSALITSLPRTESAAVEAPETAVIDTPKARKPR